MQVDKVVTYDVGILASPDSHDYGAGATCCRDAGRRVLHGQRSGWRDTAGAGSMEVAVGRRLAMFDVLEGDQEWWVDSGRAESGERESPRRVGDDALRDVVGVEPDEELQAAGRRLDAGELCALLV